MDPISSSNKRWIALGAVFIVWTLGLVLALFRPLPPTIVRAGFVPVAYPTGPAGGDLCGNYADAGVCGLQNRPVSDAAPSVGSALVWDGGAWGPSPISWSAISGTPWLTALDLDLTAQTTQNLTTNGTYSIGGLTWTKGNSADETVHASITNGTGLNFQPNASSAYAGAAGATGAGSKTLPFVWLPLSSILPSGFDWSTQLRIWVYQVADNINSVNYGAGVVAVDDNGASVVNGIALIRGYNGSAWTARSIAGWGVVQSVNYNANRVATSNMTFSAANEVIVLEIPAIASLAMRGYTQAYDAGWPLPNTLEETSFFGGLGTTSVGPTLEAPTAMGVMLGAQGNGGGSALSVTFARIRVDYRF